MSLTLFLAMTLVALFLGKTPLRHPFQWLETYYHELSHGIAAMVTGGRIEKIKLSLNGSGLCYTRGGWRFFILLAGYTGASLWGAYLYLTGWHMGNDGSIVLLAVELGLLALATLLWVRDPITLLIMLAMGLLYGLPLYFTDLQPHVAYTLQFIGIYVMLNAIRAPLHLIDGQLVGDGAELAKSTLILPEGFWIAFWFVFALATLGVCATLTIPGMDVALGVLLWFN